MKCPRCGADIPEEALLCPECGEDIKFVPEYDPEFENSMSESLSELAGDFGKMSSKTSSGDKEDELDPDDIEAERQFDANEEGHILGSPVLTICLLSILLIALGFGTFRYISKSGVLSFEKDMREDNAAGVALKDEEADNSSDAGSAEGEDRGSEDAGENAESEDESASEEEEVYPAPAEPTILEESGEYSEVTQIVAVGQSGSSIYYTNDGTDPVTYDDAAGAGAGIEGSNKARLSELAVRYTAPISMPYGDSVFRFVAVDDVTGTVSVVVERKYSFHYPVQFSHEQAVSALIAELIDKGYLLDGMGTVAGMEGYNLYIIQSTQVIDGADYYVITENHVYPDGSQTQSGLLFGVNVTSGLVYRLGSDEQGNYFLKPLT